MTCPKQQRQVESGWIITSHKSETIYKFCMLSQSEQQNSIEDTEMSTKYPSEDYHGVNTVTFNVKWIKVRGK